MSPVAAFPEPFGHGGDRDPDAWPFVVGRGRHPVLLPARRERRGIAERGAVSVQVVGVAERDGTLCIALSRQSGRMLIVRLAAALMSRRTRQRCGTLSDRRGGGAGPILARRDWTARHVGDDLERHLASTDPRRTRACH